MAPSGCEAATEALNTEEFGHPGKPLETRRMRGPACQCSEPSRLALVEAEGPETCIRAHLWFPSRDGQVRGSLAKQQGGGSRGKQAALRMLRLLERAAHGGAHRNVPALCFDRKLLIQRS